MRLDEHECNSLGKSLTISLLLFSIAGAQSSNVAQEYRVKAAYLCNLASFVEWPSHTFTEMNTPVTICIFGEDPFGGELDRDSRGKSVEGRALHIAHPRNVQQAKDCRILFISNSERRQMPQVLQAVSKSGVLTVADMSGFRNVGGMIGFVMDNEQVRFEINLDAVQQAGLHLSSRLLTTAKLVTSTQNPGGK